MYETLDNEGCIDVLYCDFIKAIDKEPHHRLLEWTAALLAHRTQRVRVNNSYSDRQDVISEIPKGSVIDPLLFVIFINDLPNVVSSSDILLFADGMKLFRPIYTQDDCVRLQDLILAEHWTDLSLLKFYPSKPSHTRIGKSYIDNYGYTLGPDHTILNSTDKVKEIGVTFEYSLNIETHTSEQKLQSQPNYGHNTAYRRPRG